MISDALRKSPSFSFLWYAADFDAGKLLSLKNVIMSYLHYDLDIIVKHKVMLVGWPPGFPITNPSSISTMDQIKSLRDALKVGDCHWIKMTKRQQEVHAQDVKTRQAAGELAVVKSRKERSDKGKKKQKAATGSDTLKKRKRSGKKKQIETRNGEGDDEDQDDNEDEVPAPPKKKLRKNDAAAAKRALPPLRSRSHISSDEDEDEEMTL
jgi:hypothetical protein